MRRVYLTWWRPLLVWALILSLGVGGTATLNAQPTLTVVGDHFRVDGMPRFLLFISYYDAMRRSFGTGDNQGDLDTDFSYFSQHKIAGIRILPNWFDYNCTGTTSDDFAGDSLFVNDDLWAQEADFRDGKWEVFTRVLEKATEYGLLVDVTFTRDTVPSLSKANYQAQIEKVAADLEGTYPNVLFDVQNEWPIHDFSATDVATIISAVRNIDPTRIVTGSTGAGPTGTPTPEDAGEQAAAIDADVAAVHDPRNNDWFESSVVQDVLADVRVGLESPVRPIYLQEPMPFSDSGAPGCGDQTNDGTAGRHRDAAGAAKQYGAAGWTFHTRLTFRLAAETYCDKIDCDTTPSSEGQELEDVHNGPDNQPWGASWTDNPVVATVTTIKAAHITELRTRINALRQRYALSASSWTDSTITPGSTVVKAVHLTELRTSLAAVYTAANVSAPTYTDASLTSAYTIKAAHINELRNAVNALESID